MCTMTNGPKPHELATYRAYPGDPWWLPGIGMHLWSMGGLLKLSRLATYEIPAGPNLLGPTSTPVHTAVLPV